MRKGMKLTALLLAGCTFVTSVPAQAGMLTVEELETSVSEAASARDHLAALLARDEVKAGLARHGVSVEDAAARVAALSDADALTLSRQMDSLPAGGDVLGLAVFVFLVLLVTDILGFTKIFPFTRSIR